MTFREARSPNLDTRPSPSFRRSVALRAAGGAAALLLACLAVLLSPTHAAAQTLPTGVDLRQLAETMSPDEIVERLRASGLSRAQVRDRLRRAGYDPSLADRYFDALESGESLEADPSDATLLEALRGVGVQLRSDSTQMTGEAMMSPRQALERDTLDLDEMEPDTVPRVFGREVFRRVSSQFEPLLTGPVGPNYVLGPGDELIVILTGDVELAYQLDVTREGYVVIPQVGQVSVNGLTLEELEGRLRTRMGQVYSTLRGSGASTRLDVSLGRLRTNQVRVAGAVARPGSYQVSSVATLLEALYLAGGPTDRGSYRRVLLQRPGAAAQEVDLYPFLTTGDLSQDPRLQEGDVVFVPPVGTQVTLRGLVRRSAIFELQAGEALPALIRFAGGLLPDARVDRAQVDRILPPEDRVPGQDRVLLDAPLGDVLAGASNFGLADGDQVQVFEVDSEIRQRVSIEGAVWRPGDYELRPGTTAGSLVQRAGGLREDALAQEVLVARVDLATGDRTTLRADLAGGGAGPLLQEFDEVTVFARDSLVVPDSVAIYGLVQEPGRYPLGDGLTAGDLVLLSGGFTKGAAPWSAEVVRMTRGQDGGPELSVSREVALRPGLPYSDPRFEGQRPAEVEGLALESDLPLMDGDEVFIRRLPDYVPPRRVVIEGEVASPGPYQLTRQDERFTSILQRAGGLTDAAFPEGARLIRDGVPVGLDYGAATRRPGSTDDPVLVDGDRIVVPVVDNTVLVTGAVVFEARAVYQRGMSLGDAIEQAGGFSEDADANRVSVEYANGSRATTSRFLWLFRSTPPIRPGSTVFVPARAESGPGFDWDTALSRILAVASTVATVYIAVNR